MLDEVRWNTTEISISRSDTSVYKHGGIHRRMYLFFVLSFFCSGYHSHAQRKGSRYHHRSGDDIRYVQNSNNQAIKKVTLLRIRSGFTSHIHTFLFVFCLFPPRVCSALAIYSLFFMRWALAVTPANYPLLFCHICNEGVQIGQLGRWATAKEM